MAVVVAAEVVVAAAVVQALDPVRATVSSPSSELCRGSRSSAQTRGSISQGHVTPQPREASRAGGRTLGTKETSPWSSHPL
eukprot:COSAG06_NODE_1308_length_9914_cov_6.225879_1_plen_81_part_00